MRSTISKEQSQELRQVLVKYKVDKDTIDLLLSSKYASNTYKAYLQKKKIVSEDDWVINFGANWARAPGEREVDAENALNTNGSDNSNTDDMVEKDNTPPQVSQTPEEIADEIENTAKKQPSEDLASRTLQSIVSLIKKPKPPPPKKPRMLKVAIELDEEVLIQMKKLADAEGIPLSSLIRLAIRKYIN